MIAIVANSAFVKGVDLIFADFLIVPALHSEFSIVNAVVNFGIGCDLAPLAEDGITRAACLETIEGGGYLAAQMAGDDCHVLASLHNPRVVDHAAKLLNLYQPLHELLLIKGVAASKLLIIQEERLTGDALVGLLLLGCEFIFDELGASLLLLTQHVNT